MNIETTMNAGEAGYFLLDNQVQLLNIMEVRVTQTVRYVGGVPNAPYVEYLTKEKNSGNDDGTWVPECRSAKTKAELLAKL
jgi:hypothetical protein